MSIRAVTESGDEKDRRKLLGVETRQCILTAAERLFSARSYHGVGVREITREARVNPAAIYYHFGSKQTLLLELLRARALPIAEKRMEMLHQFRQRGSLQLEDVIRSFLEPALFENPGGDLKHSPFAELRARLAFDNEPDVRKILSDIFDSSSRAFIDAFSECLPGRSRREIYFKFHFLLGAMFYTMSNTGRVQELSKGTADVSNPNEIIQYAIPFLAAGFRATSSGGRRKN